MKYNVIWLDDHFGIPDDDMEEMYSNFLNTQKKGKFQNFEITRCRTSEEVKENLRSNDGRFQAVILDVFGKIDENRSSDSDESFWDLWIFLEKTDLIVKIFSGELNKDGGKSIKNFMETKKLKENEVYFNKVDDYFGLFDRLQSDLDNKLSLYINYPDLLGLIQEGFLPATAKKDLDQLLIDNKNLNLDFGNKGYFRELRTYILKGLSDIGVIPEAPKGDLNHLTYPGHFNNKTKKFEDVNVSDEICPNVVKRTFYFVGNVANIFHHLDETPLKEDYYNTLLPAMYNAMILVLRWYFQIRKKYENQ